jgi:hypothetical protein
MASAASRRYLCVSVDFMIDGTERPVQRPTDAMEQQDQYSGEKKHTLNALVGFRGLMLRYCPRLSSHFLSLLRNKDF